MAQADLYIVESTEFLFRPYNLIRSCIPFIQVRRKSNRVMTVVMALEEEVVRIISVYGPQSGRRAFL